MKKIYYLSTCSTCSRIMADTGAAEKLTLQDIKTKNITEKELDQMAAMTGSYESLFSRRSLKFRAWGLHEKQLTEADYKKLILEEYTFLKRPVAIINKKIFVGNDKKNVAALAEALK